MPKRHPSPEVAERNSEIWYLSVAGHSPRQIAAITQMTSRQISQILFRMRQDGRGSRLTPQPARPTPRLTMQLRAEIDAAHREAPHTLPFKGRLD